MDWRCGSLATKRRECPGEFCNCLENHHDTPPPQTRLLGHACAEAFFGLTLLAILPRLLLMYGYGFALPLFLRGDSQRAMVLYSRVVPGAVVVIPLLSVDVLFGHSLPQRRRDKVGVIALCHCPNGR